MGFIARWWRAKGHGVHSPFAFRFVTFTLPEHGRYYAYDALELYPRAEARRLKMLLRIVCALRPRAIHAPALTPGELEAVTLADSSVRFTDTPAGAQLIILPRLEEGILPSPGQSLLVWDTRGQWPALCRDLPSGMTFTNGRTGIAVNLPGLSRQDFESRF